MKMNSIITVLALPAIVFLLASCRGGESGGGGGSGTLDTTFSGDGIVVYHSGAGGIENDFGNAMTLDSNGRILVAGWRLNEAGNNDMVIWRYNSEGTLDTTFDADGIVVYHNPASYNGADFGNAIALDSNGKILVAGMSRNAAGSDDMAIWRYNADGTPDTTFGANGIVVHNNAAGGNSDDSGNALALDSNGKILVAGRSRNAAGNGDMVLWRYNTDGTPDIPFGNNGIVVHNSAAAGNGDDAGNAIAIDSIGRIVVAGRSRNAAGNDDMAVWRYNTDGTPDTTFGANGIVAHNSAAGGNGDDAGNALAIDLTGR